MSLERARHYTAGRATSGAEHTMNEGRRTLAISILVLVVIAAIVFWMMQGDGTAVPDRATPGPTKARSAATANAAVAGPTTERTEAETAAPPPVPALSADPMLAHVRGR